MKRKKWTRKGVCPYCQNKTGSFHKKNCQLEFATIGKMKKPTIKDKIKQFIIKKISQL